MLERGYRLRDRRLRHAEMAARFDHAAVLDDSEQDVQVAQPDAATNATVPIE